MKVPSYESSVVGHRARSRQRMTPNLRYVANPEWRTRQILLPEELVQRLFEWHGGQFTATYALASSGMRNLVSLSMIDAALHELERDAGRASGSEAASLDEVIGELSGVRQFWREHSAQEAGLGVSEYEIDHAEYNMDSDEESAIDTTSG